MASGSTSSEWSRSSRFSSARTLAMPENSSGDCSAPSMTFSTTVKFSTSMKCWWTMPMPAAMAAFGSEMSTVLPPTLMVPESAW